MADVLVAGGGSAGCVLAARLSEDPGCHVVLLEAGPDLAGQADVPPDVLDASGPTTAHDWGYMAEPDGLGRRIALPRARLIGGCSSTNGCFALRGAPAVYDGWAQLGNPGWSFAEVLPFFRRLEADADFGGEWHGCDGPVPIRRHPPAELNAAQAAFIDAARCYGLPYVADHNRPDALGVGPTPRNARDGVRMSTSLTYLAAARGRPNLTIRGDAVVDRVEVRGSVATGVRLIGGEVITADRVVLAAGAYASPAILQRSGIGPAVRLSALGIGVIADLPGVGENLIDHPLVAVDLPARRVVTGSRFQAIATLRSQLAPDAGPDLHLFAAGPFDVGRDISPAGAVFGVPASTQKSCAAMLLSMKSTTCSGVHAASSFDRQSGPRNRSMSIVQQTLTSDGINAIAVLRATSKRQGRTAIRWTVTPARVRRSTVSSVLPVSATTR